MLASLEPSTTGSQPWSWMGAASATVSVANSSIVTMATATPGPTSRAPRIDPPSNTIARQDDAGGRQHGPDDLGRLQRLAAQQHGQDDGGAAIRHDDRADHAQRPDPQRREVAQVRERGADAQRQPDQDPVDGTVAEPRALDDDDAPRARPG